MTEKSYIWDEEENRYFFVGDDIEIEIEQKSRIAKIENDVPFMITNQGEIACLPPTLSFPKIGIVGETQCGKSLMMYSLAGRQYYMKGCSVFFSNDHLKHTYSHQYPNTVQMFTDKLKKLKELPRGMPIVYCYPSTNTVKIPEDDLHIRISIPFSEYIKNPYYFEKAGGLGASFEWFMKIKDQLLRAKNSAECVKIVRDNQHSKEDKFVEKDDSTSGMPVQSADKIINKLNYWINEEVFDIDKKGYSQLYIKHNSRTLRLPPILAFLYSNLCVSLITSDLANKDYFSRLFGYYIKTIEHSKEKGNLLEHIPIYIFTDEMNIVQKECLETLRRVVRQGSNMKLGLVWAAQNYSDIDDGISGNTKILFAFNQKSSDDINKISKEYGFSASEKEDLQKLEKFEFIAKTTEGEFKLYNPRTNKITFSKGPLRGFSLPPLSMHRPEFGENKDALCYEKASFLVQKYLELNKYEIFDQYNKRSFFSHSSKILAKKILEKHSFTLTEGSDLYVDFYSGRIQREKIISQAELERFGFIVLSIAMDFSDKYRTDIRRQYIPWPKSTPYPENCDAREVPCPKNVMIVFDAIDKKIKLAGPNCGIRGVTEWMDIT